MKKVTFGLILSIISISSFACRIDNLGLCGGKAYFITREFNPYSIFEFRVRGSIAVTTITTGSVVTDSIFSIPAVAGDWIEFRYKYLSDASFDDWDLYEALVPNYNYANCGTLAVTLSNFNVQNKNGQTIISFDDYASNVTQYNVKASTNSKDWVTIKTIAPTGSKNYNIPISTSTQAFGLLTLLLIPIVLEDKFKNKKSSKRKWLSLIAIAGMILFYSCKKENTDSVKKESYKYFQIEVITTSGSELSQITHL
jgi:hypothetical protein